MPAWMFSLALLWALLQLLESMRFVAHDWDILTFSFGYIRCCEEHLSSRLLGALPTIV